MECSSSYARIRRLPKRLKKPARSCGTLISWALSSTPRKNPRATIPTIQAAHTEALPAAQRSNMRRASRAFPHSRFRQFCFNSALPKVPCNFITVLKSAERPHGDRFQQGQKFRICSLRGPKPRPVRALQGDTRKLVAKAGRMGLPSPLEAFYNNRASLFSYLRIYLQIETNQLL